MVASRRWGGGRLGAGKNREEEGSGKRQWARETYHPSATDDGVGAALEAELGEDVVNALALLLKGEGLGELEVGGVGDGVANGEIREEDVVLEDVGHAALEAAPRDRLAVDEDLAGHVAGDALGQHVEERGLARARGSHDGQQLARADAARDVVQDVHLHLPLEHIGQGVGPGQPGEQLPQDEVLRRQQNDHLVIDVPPFKVDGAYGRDLGERARLVHLGVLAHDRILLLPFGLDKHVVVLLSLVVGEAPLVPSVFFIAIALLEQVSHVRIGR